MRILVVALQPDAGDVPMDAVAGALAYLAVLTGVATVVFYRQARVG